MLLFKQIFILTTVIFATSFIISEAASPIVSSDGGSCSKVDKSGITTFTLRAFAPQLGEGGKEINYILVKYDTNRKLPFSTTAFHDSLNANKLVNRTVEPFGPLPCPQLPVSIKQQNCTGGFSMTEGQKKSSGRYTWDRGHLTPVNPMRFSEDAVNKTFYCVNIAPQDSFTNQNPWKDVEVKSEVKIRKYAGAFVQTGICSDDNLVDGPETYRGWRIPSCFWKLICYKDDNGIVQVVGFIANNTLIHKGDKKSEKERTDETFIPKSQSDVLKLVSTPNLISSSWTTAVTKLLKDRNVVKKKIPSGAQCTKANTVSQAVKDEWHKWIAH